MAQDVCTCIIDVDLLIKLLPVLSGRKSIFENQILVEGPRRMNAIFRDQLASQVTFLELRGKDDKLHENGGKPSRAE